jgi:hypothetical protein
MFARFAVSATAVVLFAVVHNSASACVLPPYERLKYGDRRKYGKYGEIWGQGDGDRGTDGTFT